MQITFPRDRRLLALALAVCVLGCSITFDRHPVLHGTVCGPYPSTIGQYLKVGTSADEVLEHVGPPNQRTLQDNQIYYVYRVQPYPSRELAGLCYSKATDDSSSYRVAFGPDKKIENVVYYQNDGSDSKRVEVPGYDGTMLPAMLYRPHQSNSGCLPGLIVLHGWDPSEMNHFGYEDTEAYADLLAQQGYVVLAVSMRGWHGVGVNDCGISQPKDIARQVEWLASQPGVDPGRIGLVGGSFGGLMALLTAEISPRIKSVVTLNAPTDLGYFAGPRVEKALSSPCLPDTKSRSPIVKAASVEAPVLLIQADSDENVPPEQAAAMEDAILLSGGAAQLHMLAGAKHETDFVYTDAWAVILNFLAETLKGHDRECPSPPTTTHTQSTVR